MYIQPEKQGNRQQSMHGGYNSVAPQWCVFPLLPSPGAKWRRLRTPNYGASRCPAPRLAVRLPRFALVGALVLTLLHSHRACASPTPPPPCEHHAQTRLSPRRRDAMPQIPGLKLRLPLIIGAACLPNAPKTRSLCPSRGPTRCHRCARLRNHARRARRQRVRHLRQAH